MAGKEASEPRLFAVQSRAQILYYHIADTGQPVGLRHQIAFLIMRWDPGITDSEAWLRHSQELVNLSRGESTMAAGGTKRLSDLAGTAPTPNRDHRNANGRCESADRKRRMAVPDHRITLQMIRFNHFSQN